MIAIFAVYWAFFTWIFSNSSIFHSIEFFIKGLFHSSCLVVTVDSSCALNGLIPNFPGFVAFIVAFFMVLSYEKKS